MLNILIFIQNEYTHKYVLNRLVAPYSLRIANLQKSWEKGTHLNVICKESMKQILTHKDITKLNEAETKIYIKSLLAQLNSLLSRQTKINYRTTHIHNEYSR